MFGNSVEKSNLKFRSSLESLALSKRAEDSSFEVGLLNGRIYFKNSLKYRFLHSVFSFFKLRTDQKKLREKLKQKLRAALRHHRPSTSEGMKVQMFTAAALRANFPSTSCFSFAHISKSHLQENSRIVDLEEALVKYAFPPKKASLASKIDQVVSENKDLLRWANPQKGEHVVAPFTRLEKTVVRLEIKDEGPHSWLLKCHQQGYRFVKSLPFVTAATPHENLLRVVMADKMRKFALEHKLDRLFIPKKYVHKIDSEVLEKHQLPREKKEGQIDQGHYLVIVKEVKELKDLTKENLQELNVSEEDQKILAGQLCDMIELSGLSDVHKGNIKLYVDGGTVKLALLDTEPFSALVAKGYEKQLTEHSNCVGAGLLSALNNAFNGLDVFCDVVKNRLC